MLNAVIIENYILPSAEVTITTTGNLTMEESYKDNIPLVPVTPIPGEPAPISIPKVHRDELSHYIALAAGGAGTVSSAVYETRRVAVKEFMYNSLYQHELYIHKTLNHPHIIKLLAYLPCNSVGSNALIIELAARGTLFEYLITHSDNKRTEKNSAQFGTELAEGVYYLHSQRTVNRDLKPANLLIMKDGTLKICDFSLAFRLAATQEYDENPPLGTYNYLPLEIRLPPKSGICKYGFKVDTYAVGAILSLLASSSRDTYRPKDKKEILKEVANIASLSLVMLINACLSDTPSRRPDALTVLQTLKQPGIKFR